MPKRRIEFVDGEVYHLMNRGNRKSTIFFDSNDYIRMQGLLNYYQFIRPLGFAEHLRLMNLGRGESSAEEPIRSVDVLSYCLLGNHFHVIARQVTSGGIEHFMKKVQLGYSAYVHSKSGQAGQLYQGRFEAVHVSTEEQLLRELRYVDLNPYSHGLCQSFWELLNYKWSSLYSLANPAVVEPVCLERSYVQHYFSGYRGVYIGMLQDRAEEHRDLQRLKRLEF